MSKYDEVLRPFNAAMERELHANSHKGDRPAWIQVPAATLMSELLYHHSKLQVALDAGDGDRILEYSADIANISMMIADVCGALSLMPVVATPREKLLEDQLATFLAFVTDAPVGSGVCCCGGDMTDDSGALAHHGDHAPVDQWNHSVNSWSEEINRLLGKHQ